MFYYRFWNIVFRSGMRLELANIHNINEDDKVYTLHFENKSNCDKESSCLKVYDDGNLLVAVEHREKRIVFYGHVNSHIVTLIIVSDLLADIISYANQCLLLHASSVCKNQKSIAFLGKSHSGKSTLSSYFALQGYEVLTDDVFPVMKINNLFYTVSLQTGVKLRSESVQEMNRLCSNGTVFNVNEKCHLFDCTDSNFFPVCGLFIIELEDKVSIKKILGIEKKIQFIRHIHRYVDKNVLCEYIRSDLDSINVFRLGYPKNYKDCQLIYNLVDSILEKI